MHGRTDELQAHAVLGDGQRGLAGFNWMYVMIIIRGVVWILKYCGS